MHVQQAVEFGFGHRFDGIESAVAGVVHQRVKAVPAPGGRERGGNAVAEPGKGSDLADIERQRHGLAAAGLDLAHDLLGPRGMAVVGDDDAHAALCGLEGGAGSETAAGAGDDGDGHVFSPFGK
ncbi:hypothetical protein D3C86_1745210 [compost metagenome]